LLVVISQYEASGSVTSEGSSEAKEDNVLGLPVILGSNELSKILLGNVGLAFMIDIEKQLPTG
jgi:hypothetical protein